MNTSKINKPFSFIPTNFHIRRGLAFGMIIITALIMFEMFNYSTTQYALSDLLGDLEFLSLRWATILAIAFCGIDFAGIARLFTPEEGENEPTEVWYLFGAWMLAATMNALLTWWGVSQAIVNNPNLGGEVISRSTAIRIVPIFVAILVWLIRVLIIGTFSVAGDRLFSQRDGKKVLKSSPALNAENNPTRVYTPVAVPNPRPATSGSTFRPAPKTNIPPEPAYSRPEPTYHQSTLNASPPASPSNPSNTSTVRSFSPKTGSTNRR